MSTNKWQSRNVQNMENFFDEKFSRRYMPGILRRYRDAAGLSQQELVNIIGISKGFYSSLEMGRRVPNLDMLIKIARACGVRPGEMLDAVVAEAEKE